MSRILRSFIVSVHNDFFLRIYSMLWVKIQISGCTHQHISYFLFEELQI